MACSSGPLQETSILQTISSENAYASLIVIAQSWKSKRFEFYLFSIGCSNCRDRDFDELMQEKGQFFKLVALSQTNKAVEESPIIPSVTLCNLKKR